MPEGFAFSSSSCRRRSHFSFLNCCTSFRNSRICTCLFSRCRDPNLGKPIVTKKLAIKSPAAKVRANGKNLLMKPIYCIVFTSNIYHYYLRRLPDFGFTPFVDGWLARKYDRLSRDVVRSIDLIFISDSVLSGTGAKFRTAFIPAFATNSRAA